MSSRAKKAATSKSASQTAPAETRTPSTTASGRPASPTFISRVEEKNELANLNDRLAVYIEKVRNLESENDRLIKIVRTHEESVHGETAKVKSLYEQELSDARRLLDQLAKDKAKIQLELNKVKGDFDELQSKFLVKERALNESEKKVMSAESQINETQARLGDSMNQRRHLEDELAKLKKENDQLTKQLSLAKKQLEDETIKRVDLENRIQSIKEQLAFQQELHQQELNASMQRKRTEVDVVDVQQRHQLENQFADALKRMREENDEQILAMRTETETMYQKKLADLQNSSGAWQDQIQKAQAELRQFKGKIEDLNSEIARQTAQASSSASRVDYLERMLRQERDENQSNMAAKDEEIRKLKAQLDEQLRDYGDLLDIKIQLDVEIAAYRKLLELEESRLNMSSSSQGTPGQYRSTPLSCDSSGSGRKRRIVETEEHETSSTSITHQNLSSMYSEYFSDGHGGVEIYQVDVDGKYIKLYNGSDKDISLGGWTVKQFDGAQEVVYKFPRNVQLKSRQFLTVWSQDCGSGSGPVANNHVMKSQSWIKGNNKKTLLTDGDGEEIAWRELKRRPFTYPSPLSDDSGTADVQSSTRSSSLGRRGASSLFASFFM